MMNILFIDDDSAMNYYHEVILEDYDMDINLKFIQEPLEGLSYLATTQHEGHPEFISILFLDLNMPIMDGWEFLEKLAQQNTLVEKIYICSTSVNPSDKTGADNHPLVRKFITKPIKEEELPKYFES